MKALPVIVVATATSLGCGSAAPTAPNGSNTGLVLQLGPQMMELTGAALSSDPQIVPCVPFGSPREGTGVVTQVNLTREASEWVARATSPAAGDVEVHFHDVSSSINGTVIAGTAQGTAHHLPPYAFMLRYDLSVSLDGVANVQATVHVGGNFIEGYINGRPMVFHDTAGQSYTTSGIAWSLQPIVTIP